jgi:hypothetical protein
MKGLYFLIIIIIFGSKAKAQSDAVKKRCEEIRWAALNELATIHLNKWKPINAELIALKKNPPSQASGQGDAWIRKIDELEKKETELSIEYNQKAEQISATTYDQCIAQAKTAGTTSGSPSNNPIPTPSKTKASSVPQSLEFESPEYKALKAQGNAAVLTNGILNIVGNGQERQGRFNEGLADTKGKIAGVNNQDNNKSQPRDDKGIMKGGKANNQEMPDEPGNESDEEENDTSPSSVNNAKTPNIDHLIQRVYKKPIETAIEGFFDDVIGNKIFIKGSEIAENINKLTGNWDNEIREESIGVTNGQAKAQIEAVNQLSQRMDADGMPNLTEEAMEQDIKNLNVINHLPVISNAVPIANKAIEYYQQLSSQLSSGSVKDMTKTIIAGGLVGAAAAISTPVALTFLGAWYISRNP